MLLAEKRKTDPGAKEIGDYESSYVGELVRRYPNTKYAADARLKIDLVRDHLAGKEMEIGRFYETRGQWLAATLRFRAVVDGYQTTTHVPEALHLCRLIGRSLSAVDTHRFAPEVH